MTWDGTSILDQQQKKGEHTYSCTITVVSLLPHTEDWVSNTRIFVPTQPALSIVRVNTRRWAVFSLSKHTPSSCTISDFSPRHSAYRGSDVTHLSICPYLARFDLSTGKHKAPLSLNNRRPFHPHQVNFMIAGQH